MGIVAIIFAMFAILFFGHLFRRDRFYKLAAMIYLAGLFYCMYLVYLYVE